jgi:hypothetical protein
MIDILALLRLLPAIQILRQGGSLPWEELVRPCSAM